MCFVSKGSSLDIRNRVYPSLALKGFFSPLPVILLVQDCMNFIPQGHSYMFEK